MHSKTWARTRVVEPMVDRTRSADRRSSTSGRRARPAPGSCRHATVAGVIEQLLGQIGAHDVDAVQRRLGGDFASVLRGKVKLVSVMSIARSAWPSCGGRRTAPTSRPISASPRSGCALARDGGGDAARSASVAASRSSRLRVRSAASSGLRQTISRSPGILGRGDRRHVALVEQRHLQRPGLDQRPDRRRAQRGDPVEPGRASSSSMRAWVIMPRSPTSTTRSRREAFLELVDLGRQGARIAGVAVEHLDRHRAAVGGAQQAVDDLQLALLAVAVVAAPGQRAAAALHIARATRRRAPACRR